MAPAPRFLERFPDKASRIDALLGTVSPDPKGQILLSMDQSMQYRAYELFYNWLDYFRLSAVPVSKSQPDNYCKRNLEQLSMVVRHESGKTVQKTEDGVSFGDPAACLAIRAVSELREKVSHSTLWQIFGKRHSDGKDSHLHTAYSVIELLAKNPSTSFRVTDIMRALGKEVSILTSRTINKLGNAGVIDYDSPTSRHTLSGYSSGWSTYLAEQPLIIGEDVRSIRICKRSNRPLLEEVVGYINGHVGETIERNAVALVLGRNGKEVSQALSALEKSGHLVSYMKAKEKQSIVKANEATTLLWNILLQPLGEVAETGNPNIPSFTLWQTYYATHRTELSRAARYVLADYSLDRTEVGEEGGQVLRSTLISLLREKSMSSAQLQSLVNEGPRQLSRSAVYAQLKRLQRAGVVKKEAFGIYALVQPPLEA